MRYLASLQTACQVVRIARSTTRLCAVPSIPLVNRRCVRVMSSEVDAAKAAAASGCVLKHASCWCLDHTTMPDLSTITTGPQIRVHQPSLTRSSPRKYRPKSSMRMILRSHSATSTPRCGCAPACHAAPHTCQAPVHFLVIPKMRDGLTQLSRAEERHEAVLGHLLVVAHKVAKQGMLLDAV